MKFQLREANSEGVYATHRHFAEIGRLAFPTRKATEISETV
jgi:hypothetical protein